MTEKKKAAKEAKTCAQLEWPRRLGNLVVNTMSVSVVVYEATHESPDKVWLS